MPLLPGLIAPAHKGMAWLS